MGKTETGNVYQEEENLTPEVDKKYEKESQKEEREFVPVTLATKLCPFLKSFFSCQRKYREKVNFLWKIRSSI